MGTTGLVAQAYGERADGGETAADAVVVIMARALLIALAIGGTLLLLQWPLGLAMFSLFQASGEVEALAGSYFSLRILGVPGFLIHLVNLGVLFGLQQMRATLMLSLMLSTTNLVLDVFFVLGLGMGVAGVALGTVLAEWGAATFGTLLVVRSLKAHGWRWSRPSGVADRAELLRLFDLSGNLVLRTLFVNVPFFVNSLIAASMGDVLLALNAVLMQLFFIAIYGIDGFAHTAETLAGFTYGAGRADRLRRATVLCMGWGFVVAAVMALVYAAFGQVFVDGLTNAQDVRAEAAAYLGWLVLIPFACVGAFIFDGVFIGTTFIREMRNAMAGSAAVWGGVLYLCLPLVGYHAIWIAMTVFMAVRSLLLWAYYPRVEAGARARLPLGQSISPAPPSGARPRSE
jgi:MATE family multidrug resistance protein